jgi:hypothetical protein
MLVSRTTFALAAALLAGCAHAPARRRRRRPPTTSPRDSTRASCRTLGERVVGDVPDAATRARIERLTIEDVAIKLERPEPEGD